MPTREGLGVAPEKSVVHQEQVRSDGNRPIDGGLTGIHGSHDPGDRSGLVCDLKTVQGTWAIGNVRDSQECVQVGCDGGQIYRSHRRIVHITNRLRFVI